MVSVQEEEEGVVAKRKAKEDEAAVDEVGAITKTRIREEITLEVVDEYRRCRTIATATLETRKAIATPTLKNQGVGTVVVEVAVAVGAEIGTEVPVDAVKTKVNNDKVMVERVLTTIPTTQIDDKPNSDS